MPRQKADFSNHPWDLAAATTLTRQSTPLCKPQHLDPGVNFFVLALEALGATPQFSCEGHPRGFYVLFGASYELALDIKSAGYFSVEISGPGTWSIRKESAEFDMGPNPEQEKANILRAAAAHWLAHFGDRLASLRPPALSPPQPATKRAVRQKKSPSA